MENKKSKGISPVIATIIMVAVAIVISIAAAFWLTGLMGAFTTYENIRIMAYASRSGNNYYINVTIQNIGSLNVTITQFNVGGMNATNVIPDKTKWVIEPGAFKIFQISGFTTDNFRPGSTVRIIVVTTRASYEGQVTLP
ncbi:MAG: archaellin/type IV pilin N-terminal domain-containing protein [Candidatus Methanomethylicia archaeon]